MRSTIVRAGGVGLHPVEQRGIAEHLDELQQPLRKRSPLWRRRSQLSSVTEPAPACMRRRSIAASACRSALPGRPVRSVATSATISASEASSRFVRIEVVTRFGHREGDDARGRTGGARDQTLESIGS